METTTSNIVVSPNQAVRPGPVPNRVAPLIHLPPPPPLFPTETESQKFLWTFPNFGDHKLCNDMDTYSVKPKRLQDNNTAFENKNDMVIPRTGQNISSPGVDSHGVTQYLWSNNPEDIAGSNAALAYMAVNPPSSTWTTFAVAYHHLNTTGHRINLRIIIRNNCSSAGRVTMLSRSLVKNTEKNALLAGLECSYEYLNSKDGNNEVSVQPKGLSGDIADYGGDESILLDYKQVASSIWVFKTNIPVLIYIVVENVDKKGHIYKISKVDDIQFAVCDRKQVIKDHKTLWEVADRQRGTGYNWTKQINVDSKALLSQLDLSQTTINTLAMQPYRVRIRLGETRGDTKEEVLTDEIPHPSPSHMEIQKILDNGWVKINKVDISNPLHTGDGISLEENSKFYVEKVKTPESSNTQ